MLYCRLPNGRLVSKRSVDNAIELVSELKDGFTVFEITDEELFVKGNIVEAVQRYRDLHNVGLREAKDAIDTLRAEWKGESV